MQTKTLFTLALAMVFAIQPSLSLAMDGENMKKKHPYVFHLVQADLWEAAKTTPDGIYYPPTYKQDGFTHGTANPEKLLTVANHFYQGVVGDWLCLRMSVDSLRATGVETVFEGTAPVGDKSADFEGSNEELYPHILGGISPDAVISTHKVIRTKHDNRSHHGCTNTPQRSVITAQNKSRCMKVNPITEALTHLKKQPNT